MLASRSYDGMTVSLKLWGEEQRKGMHVSADGWNERCVCGCVWRPTCWGSETAAMTCGLKLTSAGPLRVRRPRKDEDLIVEVDEMKWLDEKNGLRFRYDR